MNKHYSMYANVWISTCFFELAFIQFKYSILGSCEFLMLFLSNFVHYNIFNCL